MTLGAGRHTFGGRVPEDPLDFSDLDGLRCYLQGIYILKNIVGAGVAVNAPEAVPLLALQRPLGDMESGVGAGGPEDGSVPCHGVG